MASRSDLIAPRSPRGFADRGAAELKAVREMAEAIRATYELWGFEGLETPVFEYTDALGKFLPDQDRPNAGVFSLKDDDEQWISLRYDLTAPLARFVAENFQRLPKPYRSYRFGPVFRNEKPGPGRFRQFLQFDADIVGAGSVTADAEMCMMMADTLDRLDLSGRYVVKVNNRMLLDGLMEAIKLDGEENKSKRLQVLRTIDKADRLGIAGVTALLGDGRRDESGAWTDGVKCEDWQIAEIVQIFNVKVDKFARLSAPDGVRTIDLFSEGDVGAEVPISNSDTLDYLQTFSRGSALFDKGILDLRTMNETLLANGITGDVVRIDPSVVRGLEYYTGPVYEAELTFTVHDDEGRPIQFGSVGGGGRYDGLVGRFMAENVPATGFSIGVSRLLAALSALKGEEAPAADGPVVVLVMDRDRIGDSMAQAKRLRDAGIVAEVYLGGSGMKAQMKYADRRRSPCVVIQGSDEREKGEVTLKDLVAGAAAAKAIADRAEWTESRPAQVTVAEDRLVEEVKAILARQG